MKQFRPEDPIRLCAFKNATQGLQWNKEHLSESLDQLFRAVDDLATAEVKYYYRRRTTRVLTPINRMQPDALLLASLAAMRR